MSGPFGSSPWGYNPGGSFYSYSIDQSLRFEDGDSAHLDRTYSSSAGGNTKTWTWSSWVKIGNISAQKMIFSGSTNTSNLMYLQLRGDAQDNRLDIKWRQGSGTTRELSTNRQFRDVSAWYHIVWAVDTTQATDSNKMRLYINGVEETSFSADNRSTISQDSDLIINANSADHSIGTYSQSPSSYFDGYLAEMHFVDGTQLDSTSFGETKDGIWIPKAYSGSYGTNGFYLSYKSSDLNTTGSDRSDPYGSATDQPNNTFADNSGSGNHWTISGLVASDVVLDSPTNNFATLNPLDSNISLSEGNLKALGVSGSAFNTKGSFNFDVSLSDGWYFEFLSINGSVDNGSVGLAESVGYLFSNGGSPGLLNNAKTYNPDGSINFSTSFAGDTWGNGDIIGVAVKNGKVYYSKNGVFQASADPANETNPAHTGLTGFYAPFMYAPSSSVGGVYNFGQDSSFAGTKTSGSAGASDANGVGDFYYAPPSGFLAMASSSLPEPEIIDGSTAFSTVLYTGTSNSNSVTGVGFSPDFTWLKQRNSNQNHGLFDSVRGSNKFLISNGTAIENTRTTDTLSSFDSDGFTVTAYTSDAFINYTGRTMVAWNWLAGTAFSNDASATSVGDTDSEGQVNTKAGFAIIKWTSGGSSVVAHGLGKKPDFIIIKSRDGTENWLVGNSATGFANRTKLNLPDAQGSSSAFSGGVTTTTFTENIASSSYDKIGYLFANTEGYCKAGSYVGNGDPDGTFVYTGFRPAWIMWKSATQASSGWYIVDTQRNPFNEAKGADLYAQDGAAEPASGSGNMIDINSNGFKHRSSRLYINGSGATYIYLAFAEQPFKFANAR